MLIHLLILILFSSVIVIWQQSLELAQDMQNMRISKKKRQRVRPLPGTFYLAKTSGVSRISLKGAVGYKCPELHTEEQVILFILFNFFLYITVFLPFKTPKSVLVTTKLFLL